MAPREQRLPKLRAALEEVNKQLPHLGGDVGGVGVGVPSIGLPSGHWRPFVPLAQLDAHPHTLVRFFADEAFVLPTKERVPYLIFAECVDAESHAATLEASLEGRIHQAQTRVKQLTVAMSDAAGRAALFAKRRRFSFERMPSASHTPSTRLQIQGGGINSSTVPLGSPAVAPTLDGRPSHRRSNSDPEACADGALAMGREERGIASTPTLAMPTLATPTLATPTGSDGAGTGMVAPAGMATSHSPPPEEDVEEEAEEAEIEEAEEEHDDMDVDGYPTSPVGPSALPGTPSAAADRGASSGLDSGGGGGGGGGLGGGGDPRTTDEQIEHSVSDGFGELWEERAERLRATSAHAALPGWAMHAFIVKSNDELLQEQCVPSIHPPLPLESPDPAISASSATPFPPATPTLG